MINLWICSLINPIKCQQHQCCGLFRCNASPVSADTNYTSMSFIYLPGQTQVSTPTNPLCFPWEDKGSSGCPTFCLEPEHSRRINPDLPLEEKPQPSYYNLHLHITSFGEQLPRIGSRPRCFSPTLLEVWFIYLEEVALTLKPDSLWMCKTEKQMGRRYVYMPICVSYQHLF